MSPCLYIYIYDCVRAYLHIYVRDGFGGYSARTLYLPSLTPAPTQDKARTMVARYDPFAF
jgi:hypothetical protein